MATRTGKVISFKEFKKIEQARIYDNPGQIKETTIKQYEEVDVEEKKRPDTSHTYKQGANHD